MTHLPVGAKEPVVLDDQIARPNGVMLAPGDGKTFIVNDTLGPTVYAYDVLPDGGVKKKRTFAQLLDIPEGKESGADGMALDREDRLYVTTVAGVQVFDAAVSISARSRAPASAGQCGVRRPRQARALHHGARRSLSHYMLAQGPDRIGK